MEIVFIWKEKKMGWMIFGAIILLAYFKIGYNWVNVKIQKGVASVVIIIGVALIIVGGWTGSMFYADPGYTYQVRTITGTIKAETTPGWHTKWFGTAYPWKKAMSVAHTYTSNEEESTSATRPPYTIRMLDRVDGEVTQTTRFRLPEDSKAFLEMAAEYRTPENLLNTELIPTVEQVITATSSLMGAEDYFNGKRNDFQMDFVTQMREGMFMVNRKEERFRASNTRTGTADASKKTQSEFGDQQQTRFIVTKVLNSDGTYKVNKHNYHNFGITVVDAKITDFEPNIDFKKRMKDQQQASADRSIAREQRIQEEEQKQLVIVRGDRVIAEEQALVKKDQIKKTTSAETAKALALIKANLKLEQAEIDKQTAAIDLEKNKLIAKSKNVLADADKYEREARIKGDNALQQKLDTEIAIQRVWAEAFAKRAVPNTVFSSGGNNGSTPTGSNTELQSIMQMMTMQMAKDLDYDRTTSSN